MQLSYTAIQRLGIATLLALTLVAVVCTVVLNLQVSQKRQAELNLYEAKWNRFSSIAQLFAEAGVQFSWDSWNTEKEDPATLVAIKRLDSIRSLAAELQEFELSADERKALQDLIRLERRFRAAAYAYRATFFSDAARDDAQATVEEISQVVAESVVRARHVKDQAAAAIRRTRNTITSAMNRSILLTIVGGGLILFAGAGISIYLSRALARPVREMLKATEELASGNLSYRLNSTRSDILGRLSRAVDLMAGQIETSTGALRAVRDDLEAKVRERTADLAEANEDLEAEIGQRNRAEQERERALQRRQMLNDLQQSLLGPCDLDQKLKRVADAVVDIFGADFCRIWITQPGDRCESGCVHAEVTEGPHVCSHRDRCLWLLASSGRYTHTDGDVHRRVPFGCYKIGRVASGQDSKFLTNAVADDPRVHNHEWARELGLVSFAGYQLRPPDGDTIGVLGLFAKHPITPNEDAMLESLGNTVAQVVQTARAQEEATQQNRFLNTVLESLSHPFLVINVEDRSILMANSAARPDGRAQATTCHALLHLRDTPCDGRRQVCPVAAVQRTGKPITVEQIRYTSGGSPRTIEVHAYPVFDRSGRVVQAIEYSLDITERKRAEQALKEYATELESSNAALREASAAAEVAQARAEQAKDELEAAQRELLDASHQAGMAEVATSVLHNVGNVLNSVNVSASIVVDKVRRSEAPSLARAVELLGAHTDDLGTFLTEDERGKHLPRFLAALAESMTAEQAVMLEELQSLTDRIEHIKTIVSTQQSYACAVGLAELVSLARLLEDALKINASSLQRHSIEIVRDYADLPSIEVDKQKLLQILVNLIRNAKHALVEQGGAGRQLTLRVADAENDRVRIVVSDNGVGIPAENLTRIFAHGFTTKQDSGGHGFGLHHGALLAREMGGSLTAQSDGPGKGATFTVELPLTRGEPTE